MYLSGVGFMLTMGVIIMYNQYFDIFLTFEYCLWVMIYSQLVGTAI